MKRVLFAMLLGAIATQADAAVISIDGSQVQANATNQPILISITGGESLVGATLFAQIGDGGTYTGGSDTAPVIESADLTTGTIFENVSPFVGGETNEDLVYVRTVDSDPTPATGLLATLYVDTTGMAIGEFFDLKLTDVAGSFDTVVTVEPFDEFVVTGQVSTTITVVPEPGVVGLGSGLLGLLALRRRRAA